MLELIGADLIVGDSALVLRELPDDTIDLTVTSPPYDNMRDYGGYVFDFEAIASQLYRVTKPGGVVVWIVADATIDGDESGSSFRQALFFKECGFRLHDTMIWNKGTFRDVGSFRSRYFSVFDYMFILSKGAPKTFTPIKDRRNKNSGKPIRGTIRQPNGETRPISNTGKPIADFGPRFNVWEIPTDTSTGIEHPAISPENLVADHIKSWSNPGDLVLDPFSGSGTTAKMAYRFGRRFLGIEISPEYVAMSQKRLAAEMCPKLFSPAEMVGSEAPAEEAPGGADCKR